MSNSVLGLASLRIVCVMLIVVKLRYALRRKLADRLRLATVILINGRVWAPRLAPTPPLDLRMLRKRPAHIAISNHEQAPHHVDAVALRILGNDLRTQAVGKLGRHWLAATALVMMASGATVSACPGVPLESGISAAR